MPHHSQSPLIKRINISIPIRVCVVFRRLQSRLYEAHVEIKQIAGSELVDHPCEREVLDLVVWIAAAYIGVVAGEPALDQFGGDGTTRGVVGPGCGWFDPPECRRK